MLQQPVRLTAVVCVVAAALLATWAPSAGAVDGRYTIDGGTADEQAQVHLALRASAFDWQILPPIVVHIARGAMSSASPGEVVLDADLLDAGRFSWGVVQHEFAHELDFLVLDDADRTALAALLGGQSWWPNPGLSHGELTCERFASTLAWAYWESTDNVMRPSSTADEAGAASPAAFRALLTQLLQQKQEPISGAPQAALKPGSPSES